MRFFKGFVPTKNKKCLMSFKDKSESELLTLGEAEQLDEYAGILAEDTILVDVDDSEESEILLNIIDDMGVKCRVYQTTRGKHFLFKGYNLERNKTHAVLACGITADIKLGSRTSYSVLKYGGQDREIEYDKLPNENYDSLPFWMIPVKSGINFRKLKAGDGRNQAFFNYILTLQTAGLSVDQCRECIRIINKYIIPDPLPADELETVLRDESFQKPIFYDKKGRFLFDVFAQYLQNDAHIIRINGRLHIYRNGIYEAGEKPIQAEMIKHISDLNRTKRAEVFAYLDLLNQDNIPISDAKYIAFRNGVYSVDTGELLPFSADYIITNKINHDYVPEAYNELTDKTLNKISCNDPEIRALLDEVIGYTFFRRNELRKAFILIGDKANGKSTYLDMLNTLLGSENTVALDLKELGERFKSAEMYNKLAVIGDDIGDEFIPNPAVFKKVASGDRVNVEQKGKDPFDFNPYAKLLFSANDIPRMKDKSGAVIDRLVIIPFNRRFSKDDPDFDPYIKYKLRSETSMQYLIKIGLDGLRRVLDNNGFTISGKVKETISEYERNNNPVLLFFDEEPKIENEPVPDVYRRYNEFCAANSFVPLSNREFGKHVRNYYNLKSVVVSVNGKKIRIYKKSGE